MAAFRLAEVVPWGRSFDEYVAMFALSETDLGARILGCGDGPAAFNATLSARAGRVVSFDPLYLFGADAIRGRIGEVTPIVLEQLRQNLDGFVWHQITSVDMLADMRHQAMTRFLDHYSSRSRRSGRYVAAALPVVPFQSGAFDIALCSHLLFLYSEQLSLDFHLASLRELCRVAADVRVFPLVELGRVRSRHLDAVVEELRDEGYAATIRRVDYEFQRGGCDMLQLRSVPRSPSSRVEPRQ